MKFFFYLKNSTKIGLLLLGFAITSCNTLKRVDDNELLLTKNLIYVDDKKIYDEDVYSLIVLKPNSTLLGYPLRLNLYNLAKKDSDADFQYWLHKKEKREQRLINFISKKQLDRLGESFIVKGASEWLKKIGEAPAIIDSSKTQKSLKRLKKYYNSKGFFNSTASFKIDSSKRKKKAVINYNVNLGEPYIIDSLSHNISSNAIDSLYLIHLSNSYIRTDEQFNFANFNKERQRLTTLFRNSGVYNFQESSISLNILGDTLLNKSNHKMNVELNIDDLKRRANDSLITSKYKIYHFGEINIYPDFDYNLKNKNLKSTNYQGYTIHYRGKLPYKPKALTEAIFFKKDSIYRDIDKAHTYRQIANLNTFKYPNIETIPNTADTKLITNIFLASKKKYASKLDANITHSSIQRIAIAFSSSLFMRNVFGGAETLSLTARESIGLLSDNYISEEDFVSETRGDINLVFPRIWFPLINTKKIIPPYKLPQTRISIGISFQKNIGLDKKTLNTTLRYNWSQSNFKKHTVELLSIQFVRNVNSNKFFNVYNNTYNRLNETAIKVFNSLDDTTVIEPFFTTAKSTDTPELIISSGTTRFTDEVLNKNLISKNSEEYKKVSNIEERRKRLTENNLIFASNYSFTKNNKKGVNDNNFYQFRFKIESAGNLLSGLSYLINLTQNEDGHLLLFDVPYSQYIKTEFDYIKNWSISRYNVLAFRSFFGIAIPYVNSDNIPFARSYFAGGSNDNRAWHPYSLGPGKTQNINDFNEANLKIALNVEYRFPIVGDIKGALFADAGNIWNVLDNVDNPEATFNGLKSLKDIGLGTGLGIRYDLTYFVIRLDTGFKIYNPAKKLSRRWFTNLNFSDAILNVGINYPF